MEERLQKIVARAGVASRRKAEQLILEGRVTVNGHRVTELGAKADAARDHIKVNNRLLRPESLVYFALNKPRGVLSAVSDPQGRPVATDFVRTRARIYPAGRLDYASEGLLILTNDGELARKITQAGRLAKVYRVKVSGRPAEEALERLRRGMRLPDGEILAPCEVQLLKGGNNCWYQVVLIQGRNRQIRRMFEAVGHFVMRLRRTRIGPVDLGDLAPGQSRALSEVELRRLQAAVRGRKRPRTGK
ncbi:MAG: pseudouridine synthase [Acidobacteriota bacterium]